MLVLTDLELKKFKMLKNKGIFDYPLSGTDIVKHKRLSFYQWFFSQKKWLLCSLIVLSRNKEATNNLHF